MKRLKTKGERLKENTKGNYTLKKSLSSFSAIDFSLRAFVAELL